MTWARGCAAAALVLAVAGCGKKGPPLAPLVRVPAAVEQISARRMGPDVYVTFTVPDRNIDGMSPGDVERVDVFGYTGSTAPPRPRWPELGTLIATIPVLPVPDPAGDQPPQTEGTGNGATQASAVTVRETLTAVPAASPAAPAPADPAGPDGLVAEQTEPAPLRRFYMAVPYGPRNRPGPPGAVVEVPLTALPAAPQDVQVRFTESATIIDWAPVPAPSLPATPTAAPTPVEQPGRPSPGAAPGVGVPRVGQGVPAAPEQPAIQYRVYRDVESTTPEPGPAMPWQQLAPGALTPEPIAVTTFADDVVFGERRCYSVRTVARAGAAEVESAPSFPVCIVAEDVFPPPAPSTPATIAAGGMITVIWEPSTAADLAGYVVLRGNFGDDTLRPLTPAPIRETSYRDADVETGRRYVYAIVAVDSRQPTGNASAPSPRVEETAR